ncbi:MAG: Sulfotransferase family [Armatimonadetes bacterium]|nr:Sulfotransferase family [Armatimonadota bacterium]
MQRTSPVASARRTRPDHFRGTTHPTAPAPFVHPRFQRLPPPVIVIGMHRSGTSLISGILGMLGVYIGPEFHGRRSTLHTQATDAERVSGYAESAAFFRLNELLLRTSKSGWNRVEPFLELRDDARWAGWATAGLRMATHRSLVHDYLDPLPDTYTGPWGWKDPRNSLTLPLWLRLFPEARIIDVRRGQEAVVDSLHRRAHGWRADAQDATGGGLIRTALRRTGLLAPLAADPCLDRNYCRRLCRTYVDECRRNAEGANPYLSVWYEDVLADPAAAIRTLAEFIGASTCGGRLDEAAQLVRPIGR